MHTGRHTWATSSRALVEENLKKGSGGAREGVGLEGGEGDDGAIATQPLARAAAAIGSRTRYRGKLE